MNACIRAVVRTAMYHKLEVMGIMHEYEGMINDEFVPLAEVQQTLSAAREPKKLWIVKAANHRFSDNLVQFDQQLFEAIDWLKDHQPK